MPVSQAERQRKYIERHKHKQRRVNLHLDNAAADAIDRIARDRGIAKGVVVAEAIRLLSEANR